MTPATRAKRPVIGIVILTIISLLLSLVGYVRPALATHTDDPDDHPLVEPDFFPGATNRTCIVVDEADYEFKVNIENPNGTFNEDSTGVTVTPDEPTDFEVTLITTTTGGQVRLSFESNLPVQSVFLKGGVNGSNLYDYAEYPTAENPTPVTYDEKLQVPGGSDISHVSFCFDELPLFPQLTIDKTPDGTTVNAGDPISFTITVTNSAQATAAALNVDIDDELPNGFTWSESPDKPECSISGPAGDQSLHCDIASLAIGASFAVTVTAPTDGSTCGNIPNVAYADADGVNQINNPGDVTIKCADIRIEKTPDENAQDAGANDVEIGEAITFVLTVYNDGTGEARGVTVTDDLPGSGWSIVAGQTTLTGCEILDSSLSCCHDTIGGGSSKKVTVTKTAVYRADCGEVNNLAEVKTTNNGSDDDTGNIDVLCAKVEVDKTPDDGSVDAGGLASFTITTKNTGSAPALGVTLVDTLPATENGWSITTNWTDDEATDCDITGLLLTCGPITLDDGDSIDVVVQSRTTAEDCGELVNLDATASSTNDGSDTDDGKITVLCPDLHVSKSASALAPGSLSYTITATNDGEAAADGVTVSDDLDDDLTITSATFDVNPGVAGGEGVCTWNDTTNEVSCDVGGLAASDGAAGGSETVVVTILVSVPTDACGEIENTALVSAANESAEDALDNDSNKVVINVDCPDVSVTKTADEPEIDAGGEASFTIGVDGGEFGTTSDVILTDILPSGLSWTVGGTDVDDCTVDGLAVSNPVSGGETLICNFGPLDPDETKEITLNADTTTANCEAKIRNDASIEVDGDTTESNNGDWDEITIFCPGVGIEKKGGDPVNAGQLASFEITVTASGTGQSTNVVVTDDLIGAQADWTFDVTGADESDCSISTEPKLVCNFGNLDAGTVITIDLTYQTDADDCPSIGNSAMVTSDNDTDDSNDASDEATVRVDCPDLSLVKKADHDVVNAGQQIGFTIEVTNDGPGDAYGLYMEDTLPGGNGAFDWEFADDSDGGEACGIDIPPQSSSQQLVCNWEVFEPGSVTIHVISQTSAEACDEWLNQVILSATNGDGVHFSGDTVTVQCPDVTVVKEPVETPISAGEQGQFTLLVSNDGPGTAYDVEVVDTAPDGTVWTVLNAGGFDCSDEVTDGQQTITCTLDELAAEASATILIGYTTTPEDCGALENDVAVSAGSEPDENAGNNSDSATIVVECPGLNLVKAADADPIDAGEEASFTILIWNAGPGTALDADFSDELPGGLSWNFELVNADEDDTCASSVNSDGDQAISCEFGDLAPSSMPEAPYSAESPGKVIRVWAETDRTDCGLIKNTAFAGASNDDDLDATDTIEVKCPEIALEKENDAVGSVLPGTTVTYTLTLTVDDGPAEDVTVIDTMPIGLSDPTNISEGGAFDEASNTVTWDLGDLADDEYSLTYRATVADDVENGDELVNAAAATSTNSQCPDLETLGPECEDDSTVIVRVPTLAIDKVADAEVITITGEAGDLEASPSIVTWTLTYTLTNGPVTNAVITDEIPLGFVFLDASGDGELIDGSVTWTFDTLTESGSVTFRTTVDPETISRVAPTVNVAVIDSDETEPDEGQDSVTVEVEAPPLGGNPTPTPRPTPKPELPDTASGIGLNGEAVTVPLELLVALFVGSLGAMTLANVKARSRRR